MQSSAKNRSVPSSTARQPFSVRVSTHCLVVGAKFTNASNRASVHSCDERLACFAPAVSAQRNVEVIPQEPREGDVPAAPEFGNAGGPVRGVKIVGETDGEQQAEPDGYVTVS